MIKYIKVSGERIVEVRPLLEANVDSALKAEFEKEFIRADVPEGLSDIELLQSYNFRNGKFVKTNEMLDNLKSKQEVESIHLWLTRNDWIPNKIITGEWDSTDTRWLNYLKERKEKRGRLDELSDQEI